MANGPTTVEQDRYLDELVAMGLHIGLFTSPTAADGSGTEGAAARKPFVSTVAASGGRVANTDAPEWVGLPDGTYTHVALFDAATGGVMRWFGPLLASRTVTGGSPTLGLGPGGCVLALDVSA
jgi:hypothetical protein